MLITIVGCSQETTENPKEKEIKEVKEVSTSHNDTEEKVEDMIWTTSEMELTKSEVLMYENEVGSVEFYGYRQNEEGTFDVVLKHQGELTKADNTETQMRVILSDSNDFILDDDDRIEIRKFDDIEYHIYKSEDNVEGRKIVRVDLSLFNDINGNFNEEDMETIEIPQTEKVVKLNGIEFNQEEKKEEAFIRENEDMKITIQYVEPMDISFKTLQLVGNIEFKKDIEGKPELILFQPEMGISEIIELETDNKGDTFYKGTTVDFVQNIDLAYPLGKNSIHSINFTIGNELFAINQNTGEEMNEAIITNFEQENKRHLDKKTLEGFIDSSGTRVYDAIQLTNPFSSHGVGTDSFADFEYVVGGYDELSFQLGAAQNESRTNQQYDVYVYGDDFSFEEGQTKPTGEVLFSKQIKSDTPLEEVSVDVSGVKNTTIFIDSNIPSGDENEEERYVPIIISDVKVQR